MDRRERRGSSRAGGASAGPAVARGVPRQLGDLLRQPSQLLLAATTVVQLPRDFREVEANPLSLDLRAQARR